MNGKIPDKPSAAVVRTASSITTAIRRYNLLSRVYGVNASLGSSTSAEAIEKAEIRPGDCVAELGVGTGRDQARLAARVGPAGRVIGMDLAAGMLDCARRRIQDSRLGCQVTLLQADARFIPLADGTADVLFCSRLLDLVDTPEIPSILAECQRVLKPTGQIVVLHMSKPGPEKTLFERLYTSLPGFGGGLFISRPVLAADLLDEIGFQEITRVYRPGIPVGTEILWGRRAG